MAKNKQERPTVLQTLILIVGVMAITVLVSLHIYEKAQCYEAMKARPEVVCDCI